jgi:hypothetical protein
MTSTDLIPTLTALLDRWNTLAQDAVQMVTTMTEQPVQAAYYAGYLDGIETARVELTAALANALKEATKL